MDEFLSQLHILLPVLGVNAVRIRPPVVGQGRGTTESPVFTLREPKSGVHARAQQVDGEFIVLAGSIVVGEWKRTGSAASTQKSYASYQAEHARLIRDGVIDVVEGVGRTTRDHVFTSPSTAGAIVVGRSCNGRKEWVSEQGQTFSVSLATSSSSECIWSRLHSDKLRFSAHLSTLTAGVCAADLMQRRKVVPTPKTLSIGARGGTRTHTPFRTTDFESVASAIPPLGRVTLRA